MLVVYRLCVIVILHQYFTICALCICDAIKFIITNYTTLGTSLSFQGCNTFGFIVLSSLLLCTKTLQPLMMSLFPINVCVTFGISLYWNYSSQLSRIFPWNYHVLGFHGFWATTCSIKIISNCNALIDFAYYAFEFYLINLESK